MADETTTTGEGTTGTGETTAAATTEAATATTETTAAAATTETTAAATTEEGASTAAAPETYDLALPEGAIVDADDVDVIAAYAKAEGLTNEQAQDLLLRRDTAIKDQRAAFLVETQAHPEVGGDRLPDVQARTTALIDRFLPASEPDGARLRAALKKSGFDSFAPLVTLLARIAKASAEDTSVQGDTTRVGQKKSPEQVLYPSMA